MPIQEFTNSIKAKLYDFTYTPFLSSFVIAWIVINQKYILIYFADIDIEKKLKLLNLYGKSYIEKTQMFDSVLPFFNFLEMGSHFIWYPLGIALFYVYMYPYISNKFYEQTRKMNNERKKIKLEQDEKEPIDEDEKKEISLQNYTYRKEIDDLKIELADKEREIDQKIDLAVEANNITRDKELEMFKSSTNYEMDNIKEMNKKEIENLKKEIDSLEKTTSEEIKIERNKILKEKEKQKDIYEDTVKKMTDKFNQERIEIEKQHKEELIEKSNQNNEEKKIATILKKLYESKSSLFNQNSITRLIKELFEYPELKAELLFTDILNNEYISKSKSISNESYYTVSDFGKRTLIKYFDM